MGVDNSAGLTPVSKSEHHQPIKESILKALDRIKSRTPRDVLTGIADLKPDNSNEKPKLSLSEVPSQTTEVLTTPSKEDDQREIKKIKAGIKSTTSDKEDDQLGKIPTLLEINTNYNQFDGLSERVFNNIQKKITIKKLEKMGIVDAHSYYENLSTRGVETKSILKYVPKFFELKLSPEQTASAIERTAQLSYFYYGEKLIDSPDNCYLIAPEILGLSQEDFQKRLLELKKYSFLNVFPYQGDKNPTVNFLQKGLNNGEKSLLDNINNFFQSNQSEQGDVLSNRDFFMDYYRLFEIGEKGDLEKKIDIIKRIDDKLNNFFDIKKKTKGTDKELIGTMIDCVYGDNHTPSIKNLIIGDYNEEFIKHILVTDQPFTSDFFLNYIKERTSNFEINYSRGEEPITSLPDKIIQTFSPEDKKFWAIFLQINANDSFHIQHFLVENKDKVNLFFNQQNKPTALFFETLIKKNMGFSFKKDNYANKTLTQELIQTFSSEDQEIWKCINNSLNKESYTFALSVKFLLSHKDQIDSFLINDHLNSSFFEETLLSFRDGNDMSSFLRYQITPELIQTFSLEDQSFWKILSSFEGTDSSRLQYFTTNHKDKFRLFFNQQNKPTALFFESLIESGFYLEDDNYLGKNLTPELIETFSLEDQKLWKGILNVGVDKLALINLVFSKKDEIESLFNKENQPTTKLINYAIDSNIDFELTKSLIYLNLLESMPQSDPNKLLFTLISKIDFKESYDFLIKNREVIIQKINSSDNPQEFSQQYLSVFEQINTSPSKEIIKIKDRLLIEILSSTKPIEDYQKISDIFIKNNLPMVGKIFRVFETLYPTQKIDSILRRDNLSRVLIENKSSRFRYNIIFNDLLKTNLGSSESSLINYLNLFQTSSSLLEKAKSGEGINQIEATQLSTFFKKLDTLYDTSLLSRIQSTETLDNSTLQSKIYELYQKYRVKDGQTIDERITEMYFSNFGFKNISEALNYSRQSKETAHQRNLTKTDFSLNSGDLVKAVDSDNLGNILNFGCVAREYLGSNAGSDFTPFDTDAMRSNSNHPAQEISSVGVSGFYGDIFIIVKDRGQLQNTTGVKNPKYEFSKLEVFSSDGNLNNGAHGIRTGFPSSEIDFLVATNTTPQKLENIYYEIAKHGMYISVLDKDGKQIFTPKDYQKYRHSFDGVEQFNGEPIKIELSQPQDWSYQIINETKAKIDEGNLLIKQQDQKIRETIKSILDSLGVSLKDRSDTSLLGCRLENIGSSGRGTNLPNDFDFDYNLILDGPTQFQAPKIKELILSQFQHSPGKPTNDPNQIRMADVMSISKNPIELDIGINDTADTLIFSSHEAIEQKLDSIKTKEGEDVYKEVIANILVAKKILKENHAYKKGDYEDGGLGGIGVENWILANNGSVKKAFETFWQTSHKDGKIIGIEEFRKVYSILDAGENLRQTGHGHDNFSYILTEKGYKKIIVTIGKYIKK